MEEKLKMQYAHTQNVNSELLNRISALRDQINQGLANDPQMIAQEIETIISLTEQLLENYRHRVN